MVRICHMTSVHSRYDVRIFQKECKTLSANGYDVILLVNDAKEDEIINGIKIISTGFTSSSRIERVIYSQRAFLVKALELDAEIYHLHDPELLPVAKKLKSKGKKVIFDSHEYYYEQIKYKIHIPRLIRNLIARFYLIYESMVFRKIDKIIYPCALNGRRNVNINISRKTIYINNVPKLDEFYDQYSTIDPNGNYKVCHIGALTYNRGVVHLIRAAFQAGTPLILAGKFNPEGLLDDIKDTPEYQVVDYRGYVDRKEVLSIYKESKIGISTLLNRGQYLKTDNLSTKIYEYMSMGLPVIMSESPYVNSILKTYEFGISVNPEDINQISEVILYLKNNPEIAKRMGEEGRKAIREKFNWNIEERKLLELYSHL